MQLFRFIQDASLSMCILYNPVAKLFLKINNVFMFVSEQSKRSSGGHDLGPVHIANSTLFSSNAEDERLLIMASDSHINNLTFSASFHK